MIEFSDDIKEDFAEAKKKVKNHFKRHKVKYIVGGAVVVVAGLTYAIMRDSESEHISGGISVAAKGGISVLGKNVVTNNVSYISANRQGPPSWVIRCVQTGNIFSSQKEAAFAMGLTPQEVSKHLNGIMDTVRGFTFERICMAA